MTTEPERYMIVKQLTSLNTWKYMIAYVPEVGSDGLAMLLSDTYALDKVWIRNSFPSRELAQQAINNIKAVRAK